MVASLQPVPLQRIPDILLDLDRRLLLVYATPLHVKMGTGQPGPGLGTGPMASGPIYEAMGRPNV